MESVTVFAALLTAVAGIVTAIALVWREREALRHIERLTDLIPKLVDSSARKPMEELRNFLASEYAQNRSEEMRVPFALYRWATALWIAFIVLLLPPFFVPLPEAVAKTAVTLGFIALVAFVVVLISMGVLIFVRYAKRRRAAREVAKG